MPGRTRSGWIDGKRTPAFVRACLAAISCIVESNRWRNAAGDDECHVSPKPSFEANSGAASISKLLSPGIRLGYAMASEPLLSRMAAARAAIDRQGDAPLEAALAEMIRDGDLGRHARKARRVYRARRDMLAGALSGLLGDRTSFDLPAGGLAIWLQTRGVSAHYPADCAGEAGLALLSGNRFVLDGPAPQAFRLGYAALDEAQIGRAGEILARIWPN